MSHKLIAFRGNRNFFFWPNELWCIGPGTLRQRRADRRVGGAAVGKQRRQVRRVVQRVDPGRRIGRHVPGGQPPGSQARRLAAFGYISSGSPPRGSKPTSTGAITAPTTQTAASIHLRPTLKPGSP